MVIDEKFDLVISIEINLFSIIIFRLVSWLLSMLVDHSPSSHLKGYIIRLVHNLLLISAITILYKSNNLASAT